MGQTTTKPLTESWIMTKIKECTSGIFRVFQLRDEDDLNYYKVLLNSHWVFDVMHIKSVEKSESDIYQVRVLS